MENSMRSSILEAVEAWSHPYTCRCNLCLRGWVLVGPEDLGDGEWGFGPFTREEFLAAGGEIPTVEEEIVVEMVGEVDSELFRTLFGDTGSNGISSYE